MIEYNIYFSYHKVNQYKEILDLISENFENFSILDILGYYKGISEIAKCLRIISEIPLSLKGLIENMKSIAKQESILLTTHKIGMELI